MDGKRTGEVMAEEETVKEVKRQKTPPLASCPPTKWDTERDLLNTIKHPDTVTEMIVHLTCFTPLNDTICYTFQALHGPDSKAEMERVSDLHDWRLSKGLAWHLTACDAKPFVDAKLWRHIRPNDVMDKPIVSKGGGAVVFRSLHFPFGFEASKVLNDVDWRRDS